MTATMVDNNMGAGPPPVLPVRILTTGDPHFKKTNIQEMEIFTQKFTQLAAKLKPDYIVNLGDTFDEHERNHTYAAELFRRFMKAITKITPNAIVIGNHDRIDNQDFLTKWHQLGAYKGWPDVIVADKPKHITIKGQNFIFVPYVYKGRFVEGLKKYTTEVGITITGGSTRAIFAHQEFRGANYGGGKSQDGDEWPLDYPLVISGHIHDYQRLQSNIIYTGTPLPHTFGNERRKTVSLFTFLPDGTFSEERFDLKVVKKKKVNLTIDEAMLWTPKEDVLYKLVIIGNTEAISVFQKTDKCKALEKIAKRIKFDRIGIGRSEVPNLDLPKSKKTFLGLYKSMIKTDLEKELYCTIFGYDRSTWNETKSTQRRFIRRRK